MIQYVTGDATEPIGDGPKIIAHICNDKGAWGAGFVLALSKKWDRPETGYREEFKSGRDFFLGNVFTVRVDDDLYVANMIAQHGFPSRERPVAVDYEALEFCLLFLGGTARVLKATIHMPRIGAGIGGGDWNVIEAIIEETLAEIDVTVYDLPQSTNERVRL